MYLARPQNAIPDSLIRREMINLRPREIISRVDELIKGQAEASLQDPAQIFELGRLQIFELEGYMVRLSSNAKKLKPRQTRFGRVSDASLVQAP